MERLLMALLLAGGAALALYRLRAGVLLWVALAAPLILPLYEVRSSAVRFSTAYLSVLLAVFAGRMATGTVAFPRRSRLAVPLLALAAVAVLSGVQGALFYDPSVPGVHRFVLVQIYAVALVVLAAGASLLVGTQMAEAAARRRLYAVVIGVAVWLSFAYLVRIPFLQGPAWSPMVLAHGIALVYATLLWNPPERWWVRALAIGFVAYVLTETVVTPLLMPESGQWLSGWLGLAIPLALLTIMRSWRLVVGALLLCAPLLLWQGLPIVQDAIEQARHEGDFRRLQLWIDAFRVTAVRPILGVGPGNYIDYAERYAAFWPFGSPHGNFQQILAELGLVGSSVFLWVMWRTATVGVSLFRHAADPFTRALAAAILATLAGQSAASLVGDYLLPSYHNGGHLTFGVTIYSWILLGVLLGIEIDGRRPR